MRYVRRAVPRIYLSPPHLSGRELDLLREAVESNWVAPLGPQVDAFERELAEVVAVLDRLGATDVTERTGPDGIRSIPTVPRQVHDGLMALGWTPPAGARA